VRGPSDATASGIDLRQAKDASPGPTTVTGVSIRSLVTIAVVVWSVAALVAVFLGLPMLLTVEGVDLDAGLIVNALVALGTFGAAGAAVWVAISGRRQLKDERDAADHAQARLVLVHVLPTTADIRVTVNNYGDRSILDVTYENVAMEDFPARFTPQLPWVNVIVPQRDSPRGHVFQVHAADEPTQEFMQSRFPPAMPPLATPVAATVRFTDANDNHWQTTFELRDRQATRADGSVFMVGSMRRISTDRV
jgi:hypothetical protein